MKIKAIHLILIIFAIDVITGNIVKWFYPQPETMEEWQRQVVLFNACKSFYDWIPYLMVIVLSRYRIDVDMYDIMICFVILFLCLLNSLDWFVNSNWRPVGIDWIVFIVSLLVILTLKYGRGNR